MAVRHERPLDWQGMSVILKLASTSKNARGATDDFLAPVHVVTLSVAYYIPYGVVRSRPIGKIHGPQNRFDGSG
jgi:hypothetical protein